MSAQVGQASGRSRTEANRSRGRRVTGSGTTTPSLRERVSTYAPVRSQYVIRPSSMARDRSSILLLAARPASEYFTRTLSRYDLAVS